MKDHWYYRRGDTLFLKVHTSPQSRHDKICGLSGDRLHIKLKSPPVDGKANKQLVSMLAEEFDTGKAHVSISAGLQGRDKLVAITRPGCMPAWFTALTDED